MKRAAVATGVFVTLMLFAVTALAKGGVEQIIMTGPGLEQPIELTDPEVLDRFNPWGGLHRFLTVRVEGIDPDALDGPYAVRFIEDVHEWVYEFSYYTGEGYEDSYILLPEPLESQGFVHPAGWYRSSDAWTELMSEQLGVVKTPPTSEQVSEAKSPPMSGVGLEGRLVVTLLAIGLTGGIVVALLLRQHRPPKGASTPRSSSNA